MGQQGSFFDPCKVHIAMEMNRKRGEHDDEQSMARL